MVEEEVLLLVLCFCFLLVHFITHVIVFLRHLKKFVSCSKLKAFFLFNLGSPDFFFY